MKIDFYVSVIDNYGDMGFAFNLAISLSYYFPFLEIRFFGDDLKLFNNLKGKNEYKNINYFELDDINKSIPSEIIFNFFDRKIDFEFLHSQEFEIKIINFGYFLLHKGVESLHNTNYKSKNLLITYYVPSLINETGGIIINPNILNYKNNLQKNGSLSQKQEFLNNFSINNDFINKKWCSVFIYKETLNQIKTEILENKDYIFFIFDNKLQGENIVNMPFIEINDYYKFLHLCDVNFVRGENSLAESLLTGKPFLWDIYKENNGAHNEKIQDFSNYLTLNFGNTNYIDLFSNFNIGDKNKAFLDFLNNNYSKISFEEIAKKTISENDLIKNLKKYIHF